MLCAEGSAYVTWLQLLSFVGVTFPRLLLLLLCVAVARFVVPPAVQLPSSWQCPCLLPRSGLLVMTNVGTLDYVSVLGPRQCRMMLPVLVACACCNTTTCIRCNKPNEFAVCVCYHVVMTTLRVLAGSVVHGSVLGDNVSYKN